jgi:ATP-dependent RNA helicase DeaD
MKEFEAMNLRQEVLSALKRINFETPTEVQEAVIPLILSGKDLMVRAKTGTGKTGAFLIPIISMVNKDERNSAMIIVPTRELALQVSEVAMQLSKESGLGVVTVYGGASINYQINRLRRGTNIIIGTPGRIIDLIKQRELKTEGIKFLVLDEADIMFDMGFIEDVGYIISLLPQRRQTMLFSATLPVSLLSIVKKHMHEPERLTIGKEEEVTVSTISHFYTLADGKEKFSALLAYIDQYKPQKAIIFSQTQRGADLVYDVLMNRGFQVTLLHGGLTQAKREHSLSNFREGMQFMIATNVASRGLDITGISDIINFDVSEEVSVYVHRVGRSARMGAEGRAFSIFHHRDRYLIGEIENFAHIKMQPIELDLAPYRDVETYIKSSYSQSLRFGDREGYRGHPRRPMHGGGSMHGRSHGFRGGRENSAQGGRFKRRGRFHSRQHF